MGKEVNVSTATVDIEDVRNFRGQNSSYGFSNSAKTKSFPRIHLDDFSLCETSELQIAQISPLVSTVEEISMGPACWLWDYLRRSKQAGFFLPLSGGVDSTSVACIVYSMCEMVHKEVTEGNEHVLNDLRVITRDDTFTPESPQQICSNVLTTCYMASENSSSETKSRAEGLATAIGSRHISLKIGTVVKAFLMVFTSITGFIPKFKARGGTQTENLAMQNIQARVRMVLAYLLAQLLRWTQGKVGNLLVLGSSNVDEALRGYFTKYDCSSADLNPIGGINKGDLRAFIWYCTDKYKIDILKEIVEAPPTAELEPLEKDKIMQTDEEDMGMTYDELGVFGRLRKISVCGPYSMFRKLLSMWGHLTPIQVASRVKHFFFSYSINRHKMTTLTPSLHAENYSPDDNRFDLRPFLYNSRWGWQFNQIDQDAEALEKPTTYLE